MAPIKRKGASGEDSAVKNQKRVRVSSGASKTESKKAKQGKDASKETATRQQDTAVSVLREEEQSFPRGGGSVLTPLERKQIQIQATRDVLFEQKKSGNKQAEGPGEEDSDIDVDMQDADQKSAPTKKSRKSKSKKSEKAEKNAKEGVRVEGLSFKVRCFPTLSLLLYSY